MTTDQHPTNTNGTRPHSPRHLYDTGKFATLPPHMQVRPLKFVNERPRPHSANAAADGANVRSWPVDAEPTKALPKPQAVVEPPMKGRDARLMQKLCAVGVAVTVLVAAAVLVFRLVTGTS